MNTSVIYRLYLSEFIFDLIEIILLTPVQ